MSPRHAGHHLLPSSSTSWERAVSLTSAGREVDASSIAAAFDPWECPARLLPWLARERGVLLWDPAWPEVHQRRVIAEWPALAAIFGTEAGIRGAIALVGPGRPTFSAEVIAFEPAPARLFAGGRRSREQTDRFLALLPEVRVYPFAEPLPASSRSYFGRSWFKGAHFGVSGRAARRHRQRAELVRDGASTALEIGAVATTGIDGTLETFARLYMPAAWRGAYVLGDGRRQRWWGRSRSAESVVSLTMVDALGAVTTTRGLSPAEIEPARVYVTRHVVGRPVFGGRALSRRFWRRSPAPALVYDRLRLFDADRVAPVQSWGKRYFGRARFGLPPYTAIVALDIRTTGARGRQHWSHPWRGRLTPHDPRPLDLARKAIRISKAAGDSIRIDLALAAERLVYQEP